MANTLSIYDPTFYAQEALILLEKALGMAGRVHRGYEKSPQEPGSVISIRKPSTFTAQDAPGSDIDITASSVSITLNKWKEVKFALTDKELSFTTDRIINEHIRPAVYALADIIDQDVALLYKDVPWVKDATNPVAVADLTGVFQTMFDNSVPMDPAMIHFMVNGLVQNQCQQLPIFHSALVAGAQAAETLLRGSLGPRLGFEFFGNQNVKAHTKGTCSVTALLVNGASFAKGATSIDLDATSVTGTLVPGDTFVIAGNTQRYAVTNTVTAASNALAGVQFTPGLAVAPADNDAVTVDLTNKDQNLAFHRNAFALAMAPLSEIGNQVGARIASVQDPKTGVTLRSRLWYDGNNSKVKVGFDALYGVKTLDPNLAIRFRS